MFLCYIMLLNGYENVYVHIDVYKQIKRRRKYLLSIEVPKHIYKKEKPSSVGDKKKKKNQLFNFVLFDFILSLSSYGYHIVYRCDKK